MTPQEIAAMISSVGVPYAYSHFDATPEHPAPAPPFICFFFPGSDDVYADNKNYVSIADLSVELYTRNKDYALESAVEAALAAHDLAWDKEQTYLDGEKVYMTSWDCSTVLKGGNNAQ